MNIQSHLHRQGNNFRAAIVGLLLAFTFFIFKELFGQPLLLLGAITAIGVAIVLAKKTARHFHGGRTHIGDSPLDVVAISVLFLANILHPAVDGFSLYETFAESGAVAGWIFVGGIVLHECFRQSALIAAFKTMGVKWYWVIITALVGIAAGIGMGLLGSHLLHDHEGIIDIATIFAYVFIISEFYIADHGIKGGNRWFVAIGLSIGTLLALFAKAH